MIPRALAIASIVLMTTLAGCLSSDPPAAPIEDASDNQTQRGVLGANTSTEAPDGRGRISAFEETNRTETGVGGMEHTHDYWQGRERIDISYIDSGMIPFPLFPCREGRYGEGGDCYNPGTSIADYDIPADHGMIYEGTKQVILTATELTGPTGRESATTDLIFDYLTAADEPGAFRPGGVLKLNEPFVIDIKPTEADMPHQLKSLWIFRLYTADPTWIGFNVTITIVKGYDVVDWPPHPDLYAERAERTIYDGTFTADSRGTIDSLLYGSDSQWFNPERVISWGTDRIEVTVSNVQLTTQAPVSPAGFLLEYHNATKPPLLGHGAQYGGRLSDPSTDGETWKFMIDLRNDPMSYDTPYGETSRWGFRFVPNFDTIGGACIDNGFAQQLLVGCQFVPWTITYNLKIVAYGHPLAGGGEMP